MHVTAIIAAGGLGERLGADRPKQFLDLAGRPLLERTIDAIAASGLVDDFIVALPPETIDDPPAYLLNRRPPLRLVPGGRRRQDSVANAVVALDGRTTLVVIHDAARPFVSREVMARTIDAAAATGAAIAAIPVSDTVKHSASDASGVRVIERTLARDRIYLAQTPQAFQRDVLEHALAGAGEHIEATDESMLVELAGFQVQLVDGDAANVKLTTAADFESARARLTSVEVPPFRVGTGYDLHRLAAGRRLVLAGVHVPFDRGLEGHSDADIVCHAVTDAVLGAAGQGDIGRLFPDTDGQWKDADSIALLGAALDRVRAAGWAVGNVDVTVIAERPKLVPYLDAMRATLAGTLGCDVDRVSIKGKTNEGADSMGRGESMACHAVALLARA